MDTLFLDFSQGDSCYLSSIVKTHHHVESPCGANSWVSSSKHLHQIQVLNIITLFSFWGKQLLYLPSCIEEGTFIFLHYSFGKGEHRGCVFFFFWKSNHVNSVENATTEPSLGCKSSLDGFLSSTHMMTFTRICNMSGTKLTTRVDSYHLKKIP